MTGGPTPPQTLSELAFYIAEAQADREHLVAWKSRGRWQWLSTESWLSRIHYLAVALEERGVAQGDRVALFSENCPEWHTIDFACQLLGAITVPVYPTLPANQISFILGNSNALWAFYRGRAKGDVLREAAEALEGTLTAVAIDDDDASGSELGLGTLLEEGKGLADTRPLDGFRGRVQPEQIASLIYTSGTTGNPKGVVLTHANLVSNFRACAELFRVGPEDVTLSFLPLSHVFQRIADYLFLYRGVAIHYLTSIEQAPRALIDVRPTVMASVPRLYERAYLRVMANLSKERPGKQRIFEWALDVGRRSSDPGRKRFAPHLALQRRLAEKLVYSKVKERLGGRLRMAIAGGAALPEVVGRFFDAIGVGLYEGYGLTETSPVLCLNRPGACRYGSVGQPIPGVELDLAEDGEILAKGPGIMQGYWGNAEATSEAIDARGWFHTGDVGNFDDDGYLYITDRKKDLIVTSGGKNVAPQPIEQLLVADGVLSQAVVIGDNYPYITALLVPGLEELPEEIQELEALERLTHPRLLEGVEATVAKVNGQLAEHERVRRWKLMPREFSVEEGEITPTLKIRRRVVMERYADDVASMYLKSQRLT